MRVDLLQLSGGRADNEYGSSSKRPVCTNQCCQCETNMSVPA